MTEDNQTYPKNEIVLRFDFVGPFGPGVSQTFRNPVEQLTAWTPNDVVSVIDKAENWANRGFTAAGFVSYEAAPAFDPVMEVHSTPCSPLAWFGVFENPDETQYSPSQQPYRLGDWSIELTEEIHQNAVTKIRSKIAEGAAYQVNLTSRFTADFTGDAFTLYESMCRGLGGQYGAYLELGDTEIISASPELFFHIENGRITTRPMKGTNKRGRWIAEDVQARMILVNSEKERAENVMIVDLLRSDLGKIAQIGSVAVPSLFEVEQYRSVNQLTSTVTAALSPGCTLTDVFHALFPCGSVTGAPKISAMEAIADLELSPRGVYCGAIGLVRPGGRATFSVPIRTANVDRASGRISFGSGGGITWGSEPKKEFEEMMSKARVVLEPHPSFSLLETILLKEGHFALLERHVARILSSADYFGIPVQESTLVNALEEMRLANATGSWRVRVLVSEVGTRKVEVHPLQSIPIPIEFVLASKPVSSEDVFLFHKTTRRSVYDARRADHPNTYDVLLWNERGELTEFTLANFALELDGVLFTPPVRCGLLAGTLRAELLKSGRLTERVLMKDDLHRSAGAYYLNSVRGCLPARLLVED